MSIDPQSSTKDSTELVKQSTFDRGDNDALFSVKKNNEVIKLETEILIDNKLFGKDNDIEEVFNFSSLERGSTPDYESLSDDSEFFLTKSPDIESYFQPEIESCSSVNTSDSNRLKNFQE